MTREETNITIDYLKEMQEGYIEGEGYERHPLPEWYALDKAIETLEQIKWIPISVRLPEKGKQVLCCNKQGSVFTSAITYKTASMIAFGQHCDVIAWMPMPEPHESQESEG